MAPAPVAKLPALPLMAGRRRSIGGAVFFRRPMPLDLLGHIELPALQCTCFDFLFFFFFLHVRVLLLLPFASIAARTSDSGVILFTCNGPDTTATK